MHFKKLRIVTLIVVLFSIVSLSCSSNSIKQTNQQQQLQVGTKLSSSQKPVNTESDPGVSDHYKIQPGQSFNGSYQIENANPKTYNYLILTFLDYKPFPVEFGGTKSFSHQVKIKKNQKAWSKLEIGPVEKGNHDFAVLSFFEPSDKNMDQSHLIDTQFVFYPSRVVFDAGGRFPAIAFSRPVSVIKQQTTMNGLIVNKQKEGLDYLFSASLSPEQVIPFYVHVANPAAKTTDYAIIPLLDYKPITVSDKTGNVAYVKIPPRSIANIKILLTAPKAKGLHPLVVVSTARPFINMSKKDTPRVDSSVRIPITVR